MSDQSTSKIDPLVDHGCSQLDGYCRCLTKAQCKYNGDESVAKYEEEIEQLQKWMSNNPGYIDGCIQRAARKDYCYKRIQELQMAEWNL